MPIRLRRECTPTVRARSPTGPSRSSVRKPGSSRFPRLFGPGDVVIATLRDAAVNAEWQIQTALSHGARVIELDSGHSPFLTQPDELAEILSALA